MGEYEILGTDSLGCLKIEYDESLYLILPAEEAQTEEDLLNQIAEELTLCGKKEKDKKDKEKMVNDFVFKQKGKKISF